MPPPVIISLSSPAFLAQFPDEGHTSAYSASIPADHPGAAPLRAVLESSSTTWGGPPGVAAQATAFHRANADRPLRIFASGPVSMSGNRFPFVRPQLSHMEPLAKALGLDREGGWVEVWRTMGQDRQRLCKLVSDTLEWSDEANAGNTFTYCFCTKYLPRVIAAAIAEPLPSLAASPYDFLLRGAANTALLQYFLRSRPDLAILLRDVYYKKCLHALNTTLPTKELLLQVVPHFFVIHTCVAAYVGSPVSTSAQTAPPFPLPYQIGLKLCVALDPVWQMVKIGGPQIRFYPWAGNIFCNTIVFMRAMFTENILDTLPELLDPYYAPSGFDHRACRGLGVPAGSYAREGLFALGKMDKLECYERDPKKMKACSRCKVVYYCCKEHQKHDWEVGMHKPMCQKIVWDEL